MKKLERYFLIIFFIGFLFLPIIGIIFDSQGWLLNSNLGEVKEIPKFKNNIVKFCDEFLEYYEDNFGFRYSFMKLAINLKLKLFKTYPRNADLKVLKGKDGWFFYKVGNEIDDFQGRVPLSDNALKQVISRYEDNINYLNKAGIKLYVLIPPDKSVIYSEYLPDRTIFGIKSDKTRISQLLALNSDFIYPKQELLNHKEGELLYYKGDTHWTYYGAYFGYKAVMKKIEKDFNIAAVDIANFDKHEYNHRPDLINMIELNTDKEETIPIFSCSLDMSKSNLKVLAYGDSFLRYLEPFLRCNFRNITFNNLKSFDKNEIMQSKPDIVIVEIVQRNLKHLFD